MREVTPCVSFTLPGPRQAQGRSDALRIPAVADPASRVALGDRLQVALQRRCCSKALYSWRVTSSMNRRADCWCGVG